MLQIIPRPVHAALDYLYGATALMAPKVGQFEGERRATTLAMLIGIAALLTGLVTRHEGGVVKLIDFNTSLKLDSAGAAMALIAPWLLGFAQNRRARNVIIALALLEGVVVALTRPDKS